MPAPKGNQFWLLRSTHGKDKIFDSPAVLQAACYEYFESVQNNPLKERKVLSNGKRITVDKMRPFTLTGLYIFLGIGRKTWELYSKREDFAETVEHVKDIIETQKFDGAAAGFFRENIIARSLGMADKTKIRIEDCTDEELDFLMNRELSNGKVRED